MILTYQNKFVLQHRKHLAFDGYYDLTFSSHQIYVHSVLQTDEDAINETLKRNGILIRLKLKACQNI